MADLQRGANAPLTKENPDLKRLTIGVSYIANDTALKEDLQIGVILCGTDKKALNGEELIYFNQLQSADNSVEMGNDVTQVDIELDKVPTQVESIDLVIWGNTGRRVLKQLLALTARAINSNTQSQLVKTEDMVKYLSDEKALCLTQVYRHNGDWKIRAKGEGWSTGLFGMTETYGIR